MRFHREASACERSKNQYAVITLSSILGDGRCSVRLVDVQRALPRGSTADDVLISQVPGILHVLDRQVVRGKGAHPLADFLELLLQRCSRSVPHLETDR